MQEITVAELKARTATPLIDVREEDEFAAGRVPGAINIPLSQLGARLDELPDEFDVIWTVEPGRDGARLAGIRRDERHGRHGCLD